MGKREITVISIILIAVFLFLVMSITYSLFETRKQATVSSNVAKWNIKVNNSMVTKFSSEVNSFNLGGIEWQSGGHVKPGKAAPGSVGTFEIDIDPTDTDVSFIYELTIDTSNLHNDEFLISSVSETNGNEFIRTGENTYVGIARLEDNLDNTKYHVEISIVWNNNEANNDNDYALGKNADLDIFVPVSVNIIQYIGNEQFVPYQG